MSDARVHLSAPAKTMLYLRLWASLAVVWVTLRRMPLPEAVAYLGRVGEPRRPRLSPKRYGAIVGRALHVGRWRPRCLFSALVLFRALRRQGDDVQLVIGLPIEAVDHEAHAWVEIDGHDVGPPPGRGVHEPLARYP